MNQPNFDQMANQGSPQYDDLSDDDLRKLINDAARVKGLHGNIQPQRCPIPKKEVNLDQYLGSGSE